MQLRRWIVATVVAIATIGLQADPPKLPDAAVAARRQFDEALDRLNREYATTAAEARAAYAKKLDGIIATETKLGRFEAAELAKQELKRLDAEMPVAAGIAPGDGHYTAQWPGPFGGNTTRYSLHGDRMDVNRGKDKSGKVVRTAGGLIVTYPDNPYTHRFSLRTDGALLAEAWKQRADLAAGKPPDLITIARRAPAE